MSLKLNLDLSEDILRMGNPSSREVYEFDDFRLDAGHRMLYHKDEELSLAPKAVETLLALVERRGNIVSKDELLEAVWPDVVVDESNLFLYLSVLRKTLGTQKDGKPWVETLRRRGYRFSGEVRVFRNDGNGARLRLVPTDQGNNSRRSRISRAVYAIAGLTALLVSVAFGYQLFFAKRPIKSIAVLPFETQSIDPDDELVYEGMPSLLIGSLLKIPGLDVKARSTTARYKGLKLDAATIGTDLGVEAVLSSRVVQRGDELTMYVELVDSKTANTLGQWNYPRKTEELGVLTSEVMRDVVGAVRADVPESTKKRLANDYSESAEATRLYLKGLVLIRRITEPTINEGLSYLRQATVHDPYYAPAFAMIASAHRGLTLCCDVPNSEMAEGKTAALRALQLDENSAEAHSALAGILFFNEWNPAEAEPHFLRALELDPNSAIIHFQYADYLTRMDRPDEAKAQRRQTLELEPSSPLFNAFALVDGELDDNALEKAQRLIELDSNFYYSYYALGSIYIKLKRYPEAVAAYQRAKELAPENTWIDVSYSRSFKLNGDIERSRAILQQLLRRRESHFVPAYHIAIMYNQLDDTEKAFEWLEKAFQEHDPKMTFLKTGPGWKKLEADQRLQDLKHRVGI